MFSPSYVAGSAQMSKHSLENDKVDFWKKMRYGATAAVAVGTSLYAVTTAVKKQGLIRPISVQCLFVMRKSGFAVPVMAVTLHVARR